MEQKATLMTQEHTGKVSQNRKENNFYYQYTVIDSAFNNLIELRLYATNARHYACIWVHSHPVHLAGGGYAGGYGFHRASAAAEQAMCDAGIKLEHPIGGVGDTAIQDALLAIARTLTKRKCHILTTHA